MTARELTRRELEGLIWMIENATCFDYDEGVEDADRARWRARVVTTRAGRPCGCGLCPSIELTDLSGVSPEIGGSRTVLQAQTHGALLLLFIDNDRLSYLELAPTDDQTFTEFPDPADLSTA